MRRSWLEMPEDKLVVVVQSQTHSGTHRTQKYPIPKTPKKKQFVGCCLLSTLLSLCSGRAHCGSAPPKYCEMCECQGIVISDSENVHNTSKCEGYVQQTLREREQQQQPSANQVNSPQPTPEHSALLPLPTHSPVFPFPFLPSAECSLH